MPGFTVDSDGDVEMSIPQPIFEVIRAPELSSWDHAALIEWLREWERYVEKMRHRCTTTGEMFENVVATVKGCLKPKTLRNLATYVLKKPVASVTDADIMTAVQARCRTLKNEFVPDVTSLFRQKLKMDLSIDDCDARVFRYYEDFNATMEDNGLQGLIGSENTTEAGYRSRMKARCRLLVENLQPPVLKAQISRLIDLEKRDCKSDGVALFDLILEHAKVQQRFHRMSLDYAAKADAKSVKVDRKPQRASGDKTSAPRVTTPAATPSDGKGASAASSSRSAPRSPPQGGCLVCKGPHWLNDCPTATEAQREEARKKYREAKEQRLGTLRSKAARYVAPDATVRLNGLLEVPYVPDTGADKSVIPQGFVSSLCGMQPALSVSTLSESVDAKMADGRVVRCFEEVLLDLELVTIAGSVAVRSVACVILPGEGDEFLLGRDALKALGIDVQDQLAQLAGTHLLGTEEDEFPVGDGLPEAAEQAGDAPGLDQLVANAVANGLPTPHIAAVRGILDEFPDVWRETIGPDPPARVEPLQVTLRADAIPHRSAPRRYAPLQAQFVRDYVGRLVANGLVVQNNASRWASAVVPVNKPGSRDQFRLTIDYRPVNRVTLPLHVESREIFSFITEDGVFTPNRVPQGATDSALHFQGEMQKVLAPLIPNSALVWVDDVILFAPTVDEFVQVLGQFFSLVAPAQLKLNMAKSKLFEVEVLWCGRLISGAGVRHDPARVSALSTLPLPATVADLQYFICATNWLQDSLPDYARTVAPLQFKLAAEKKRVGGRSRNALAAATTWTEPERAAYAAMLSLVRDSALMASPNPDAELLVFTDVSLTGYSIVVTQVVEWDPTLPVAKQKHEMIICKGGTFKHNELNWTIVEKEAYPIIKACHDLEYLLLRPKGFRLYCDHANLIYIFAPHEALKKHVRDRLQRWAMRLCGLHYVIEHIAGEDNVWADIVSRWHTREVVQVAAVQTRSRHAAPLAALSQLRPLSDDAFIFPTLDEVREAQQAAGRERSRLRVALEEEDGVMTIEGRPWIPNGAKELLARLFVVAHTGAQGHRGQDPMNTVLQERFWIARLHEKVATFIRGCLLCKHVKGPRIIPRPYGPTFAAEKRNEALHWDFLYLGDGYGDNTYLLVVKDELTHYCELIPCATPTAFVAAEGLSMWCARFGVPDMLISDQGTHFKNETVEHLSARMKVEQVFTPVYSPWINGTIERLNKDVLQVVRVLLLEYDIATTEWPYLLPVLQANLNHTPLQSLGSHSPVELFTGLPVSTPLDIVVGRRGGADDLRTINMDAVSEQLEELRDSLHGMHKEVLDEKERRRVQDMAAHKRSVVNFDVGDFVLWSRIDQRLPNNKLLAQWIGPFKVIEARPHSFVIQHLITGREYDVHSSRLKFYADSELNQTTELLELVSRQGMMLGVEAIRDHRYNDALGRWELLISWMGLQAIEDSWEPCDVLAQDVPTKVRDYCDSCGDDELREQLE